MYTITKEFAFEAAHHLPEMPAGHKCKRDHGHSYRIVVELQSAELDRFGFVEDYGALDDIKRYIDTSLDHQDLCVIFGEKTNTTTAERLAQRLFETWFEHHSLLTGVTVCETAKTSSTFRRAVPLRPRPSSNSCAPSTRG